MTHSFPTRRSADLGMNVAKMEISCALNGLMDRFPNMRLDPDAPPPQLMGGVEQRGMNAVPVRSEEHTSELQSLMRISYAVFCLKKKTDQIYNKNPTNNTSIEEHIQAHRIVH